MEGPGGLKTVFGDNFASGFNKGHFGHFKNMGASSGLGLDALVMLEERLDVRIQVEATLSHLFDRKIKMGWVDGHLVPTATLASSGNPYRIDREECHGIKELLVILTHLYNNEHPYLIIDEPELNLHPQFQAFLMQEVRRFAGDPKVDPSKKIIFLITHSPFILDFKSVEDVKSVISFDLHHEAPRHIFDLNEQATQRISTLVPRLNVHHKQLFFSDNPIFVEGILDAQLIETIQTTRGFSISAAGSCVIDAGGCEEVNHYLSLCAAFGKKSYFLYDLDSLFSGNLRACVRADGSLQNFLMSLGVGPDFGKYCGELDALLTTAIDKFLELTEIPDSLNALQRYLCTLGPRKEWSKDGFARGRVAVLSTIGKLRAEMIIATPHGVVENIENRLGKICDALKVCNVFLLRGGALELYMPSYQGDFYNIPKDAKNPALSSEIQLLSLGMSDPEMATRYGELYELIRNLPSKPKVEVSRIIKEYLGDYIHHLQGLVLDHPAWTLPELQGEMKISRPGTSKVFEVSSFKRFSLEKFELVIDIFAMLGNPGGVVRITEKTNAGMRDFVIEKPIEPTNSEVAAVALGRNGLD